MLHFDDTDFINDTDEAADTARFYRIDPDATSIYDLTPPAVLRLDHAAIRRRRRLIRTTRQDVVRLREALASGWEIAPELAHEERRLAALEAAC
jgi:hypothetical protein